MSKRRIRDNLLDIWSAIGDTFIFLYALAATESVPRGNVAEQIYMDDLMDDLGMIDIADHDQLVDDVSDEIYDEVYDEVIDDLMLMNAQDELDYLFDST